jgi:type IV pilus assembly protein PilW
MRPLPCQRTGPRCQRGLTLIELMVGLTLGLIVTAGLLMVFARASAHGQDLARSGVQIENGRYVAELLREDLRLAGFYGEDSVTGRGLCRSQPLQHCPTEWSGAPFTLPTPVHGYGAGDAAGCLPNRRAGTDALALRRLDVVTVDRPCSTQATPSATCSTPSAPATSPRHAWSSTPTGPRSPCATRARHQTPYELFARLLHR